MTQSTSNALAGPFHGTAVQAGAVHGGLHLHPEAPPRPVVPKQLPPAVRLIDRAEVRSLLDRHHADSARQDHPMRVVVSGTGGMGKTTLAVSWLRSLRDCPDGHLHAELGAHSPSGPSEPAAVLSSLLRGLGVAPDAVPHAAGDRVALYRTLTDGQRLAVLLDDAATAEQVRPLLPSGRSITVVTSRQPLPGLALQECRAIELPPLTQDAAVELLAATLADGRVHDHPDAARKLADACSGLPLAVRVLGGGLTSRPTLPLNAVAANLTIHHTTEDDVMTDRLDDAYQRLPTDAALLFRLLGLHPTGIFDAGLASALLSTEGVDHDGPTEELLDRLQVGGLLNSASRGRYRFHDRVREHAAAVAERESEQIRTTARQRIVYYYLAGAALADELISPLHATLPKDPGPQPRITPDLAGDGTQADGDEALAWLRREHDTLMAVQEMAEPAGLRHVVAQITDAMWSSFLRDKRYRDWDLAHQRGLECATALEDLPYQCRMLTSGGLGLLDRDPVVALAKFEKAAELFKQMDGQLDVAGPSPELGYAQTLNFRGRALHRLGRDDAAASFFRRAINALTACDDLRTAALARHNLAELAVERGDLLPALNAPAAARDALMDAGDLYDAARAARLLARIESALGATAEDATTHDARAERWFRTALEAQTDTAYERALTLHAWADHDETRGNTDQAAGRLQQAKDLYLSAGHHRYAADVGDRLRELIPKTGA